MKGTAVNSSTAALCKSGSGVQEESCVCSRGSECVYQYLVGGGGSSTACEGVEPGGATTVAAAMVTGNGVPAEGSGDCTTGMGAIWII